jgi:hypothetical protein
VTTRCLAVHVGLAALRTVWAATVNSSVGRGLAAEVVGIALVELAAVALWRLAKPGHARESLALLKAFNVAQALVALLQFLYTFEYYVADLRKLPDLGETAAKRLADEGAVSASAVPFWVETLRGFTVFLDLTLLLFVLFGVNTAHGLIMDKMQAQKARESKRAGAGAAQAAAATGAAASGGAAAVAVAELAATTVTAAKASDRTRARRRHA